MWLFSFRISADFVFITQGVVSFSTFNLGRSFFFQQNKNKSAEAINGWFKKHYPSDLNSIKESKVSVEKKAVLSIDAWEGPLAESGVCSESNQTVCIKCMNFSKMNMSPVKRICVFEHSVMTNFNCACPAIRRGQGSGFLSEGSSWFTACMSEQRRFWRDCADAQARLNLRCSHRR